MPSLPPHEKTAEWLTLRIHKNPKSPEYQTFCERQFDSYLSCYETHSNRPHVHILVKIKVSRSNQIKNLLKKQFSMNGNTDFSVKNVVPTKEDLHEVCKYTCKGDGKHIETDVVFKSADWSNEKILELKTEYYKQQRITDHLQPVKVDLNVLSEVVIKEKISRKTWTQKIVDELIDDYPEEDWDFYEKKHQQFITDYVLRKLGEARKIFNEYKLKEFVFGVFNALDAKNFRSDISARVMGMLMA